METKTIVIDGDEFLASIQMHEAIAGNGKYGRELLRTCAETIRTGKTLHPDLAKYLAGCLAKAADAKPMRVAHCFNLVRKPGYRDPGEAVRTIDRAKLVWKLRPRVGTIDEAFRMAEQQTGISWSLYKKAWRRWRKYAPHIFGNQDEVKRDPKVIAQLVGGAYGVSATEIRRPAKSRMLLRLARVLALLGWSLGGQTPSHTLSGSNQEHV